MPPTYKKTYYQNVAVPSSNRYPVSVMPTGLQMLAGNHAGTGPNPRISFLCTGSRKGYTNTIPTDCVPDPVKGTQLNIGISFPTCWDGMNLSPTLRSHHGGYNNMAYADKNGACPDGYPVRVPHLSINLAYALGQVRDLTHAQLSKDPTEDAFGNVSHENWGSPVPGHADFFNGWQPKAMRYLTEQCLNKERVCAREIPYDYYPPEDDTTVSGGDGVHTTSGRDVKLVAEAAQGATLPRSFYMMFQIPEGARALPARFKPEYKIMIHGGNVSSTAANVLQVFVTDSAWNEDTMTMTNAPACGGRYVARLNLNHVMQYRYIDVSSAVANAIADGKQTISFCVKAVRPGNTFEFSSKEGPLQPHADPARHQAVAVLSPARAGACVAPRGILGYPRHAVAQAGDTWRFSDGDKEPQMTTLAFIGLGAMGAPMVGHLIAGGHTVRAFVRRPESRRRGLPTRRGAVLHACRCRTRGGRGVHQRHLVGRCARSAARQGRRDRGRRARHHLRRSQHDLADRHARDSPGAGGRAASTHSTARCPAARPARRPPR